MRDRFSISDIGLQLIKTYEGYRPVDIELVSGQRVAGYGHRVMNGESIHLNKKEAEALLRDDLAPYEAMINDHVFAPLTQSQFDALCSLAFNIGPKKFLESDVVHALNNGRVIDAASGFDVWRRANIGGESYVVDALVRRRTAEKVLFLRPIQYGVRAPRAELAAEPDTQMLGLTTASERVYEDSGLVRQVNYDADDVLDDAAETEVPWIETTVNSGIDIDSADDYAAYEDFAAEESVVERRSLEAARALAATPMRRKDDHPGGVLTLSEILDEEIIEDNILDDGPLIEDLEGFTLDIETDNIDDIPEGVSFDDAIIVEDSPLAIDETIADEMGEGLLALDLQETDFDPDSAIVAQPSFEGDVMADPSPIAEAAAEVSGRLDALMVQGRDETPQQSRKVLPFPPRKGNRHSPSETDESRLENNQEPHNSESISKDGLYDMPAYGEVIETDEDTRKDSAARYIARNVAPERYKKSGAPMNALIIFGMSLLGGCIGAMASGFDTRFGVTGEFISAVGVLVGLMITLGSVYYKFKNIRAGV